MKRGFWLGLGLVGLVLFSPLIIRATSGEAAKQVATSKAIRREIRSSIIASGTFLYENQVQLSPEVLGRVTEVMVREGDVVREGDLLLRIQDVTYTSEVAQRNASLASARSLLRQRSAELVAERKRFDRLATLQKRGFAATASVEDADEAFKQAQAQLAVAEANVSQSEAFLSQAKETLRKTVIRAPSAGVVVAMSTRVGETVVPSSVNLTGSSLLTIAETSAIVADVNVDEADIGNVAIGQEVSLTAAAFPKKPIRGRVQTIALTPGRTDTKLPGVTASQGSQARTYSVRVSLTVPPGSVLRSGMTCRAEIYNAAGGPQIAVPVEAILAQGSNDGVTQNDAENLFIVRNGRARRQKVLLGSSDDQYQAVRSGLKPGDIVVSGPAEMLHNLKDGDVIDAR